MCRPEATIRQSGNRIHETCTGDQNVIQSKSNRKREREEIIKARNRKKASSIILNDVQSINQHTSTTFRFFFSFLCVCVCVSSFFCEKLARQRLRFHTRSWHREFTPLSLLFLLPFFFHGDPPSGPRYCITRSFPNLLLEY